MALKLNLFYFSVFFVNAMGQFYDDKRCRCICPGLDNVYNTSSSERRVFRASVPAAKCNCEDVILPQLDIKIVGHETAYCQRCECKFEKRSTGIIKVVVVVVLCSLGILTAYMTFLQCLDPFVYRRNDSYYTEHEDDETVELMMDDDDIPEN